MTDIALDETPAEEFSRLVIEYNEGERQYRAEAWNLIADFALEHCDAILRALRTSPSQVAPANPAQVMELIAKYRTAPDRPLGLPTTGKTIAVEWDDFLAITAAIGAGGQAVAGLPEGTLSVHGKDVVIAYDDFRDARRAFYLLEATLSQPHPADERVVEALERHIQNNPDDLEAHIDLASAKEGRKNG